MILDDRQLRVFDLLSSGLREDPELGPGLAMFIERLVRVHRAARDYFARHCDARQDFYRVAEAWLALATACRAIDLDPLAVMPAVEGTTAERKSV